MKTKNIYAEIELNNVITVKRLNIAIDCKDLLKIKQCFKHYFGEILGYDVGSVRVC